MAAIREDMTLEELRALVARAKPRPGVSERLVRSIQQSMRVEGYDVTTEEVRTMAEEILEDVRKAG